MEEARLAVLEAELKKQKEEISRIYSRVRQRAQHLKDDADVEGLAYQLHNLYCAYEDLFKMVADNFENNITEGVFWHKEILRRMSVSIEGIRPNLISRESEELLSDLRAFRHFFRHAYGYELDAKKVTLVLEGALKLEDIFGRDLNRFLQELRNNK